MILVDVASLPPVVSFHLTKTLQVPKHPGYHTGDTSDTLEKDESRDPLLFGHGVSSR